jgi:dTDP-glucose 4,6-dehydratase
MGWAPQVDFEEGLKETVAWYQENEWWWRPLRENVYSGERLGVFKGR